MMSVMCLECKKEFNNEKLNNAYACLTKHLKKDHKMSQLEYVLKYIENNHPLCACGCGEKVKFKKWRFDKYYSDHKSKMKTESIVIEKMRNSLLSRTKVRYQDLGLTKEDLFESFELYKTEEYNSDNLSKKYGVDYRVLKKILDSCWGRKRRSYK